MSKLYGRWFLAYDDTSFEFIKLSRSKMLSCPACFNKYFQYALSVYTYFIRAIWKNEQINYSFIQTGTRTKIFYFHTERKKYNEKLITEMKNKNINKKLLRSLL